MISRLMKKLRSLLGCIHEILARSPWTVRLCVALRNQANAIIVRYLGGSLKSEVNGELLLASCLAPQCESFFDVGANSGDWTVMWLQHAPERSRGILFEPSAKAFQRLSTRLGHNPQLSLINKAASDEPGVTVLSYHAAFDEKSTLVRDASINPEDPLEEVELTTVDIESAARFWKTIDFLKIDAEGFDSHVLRGCESLLQSHRIKALQFEYGGIWAAAGSTLTWTLNYLQSFGYAVYLLRKDGLYHFNVAKFGEFFGYSNFVAVHPSSGLSVHNILRGKLQ